MRRRQHGAGRRGARLSVHARSIPVTAAGDGVEHEVTDEAIGGGHPGGRYQTLCGELIAPAALTEPPGRPCPGCAVELTPLPELISADSHVQRRALAPWLHDLTARTNRLAIREAVIPDVAA
ncbi:hypothetical protein [Pseudonocardia sp. KRD291]|uniref:hypothetical protein n=1 Tax=Pseudonocardia sp. KRD291 TaxID=2792007 RepID=UPI001C49E5E0|nr:hypothetical protein [Pseudonocardia sp. KRD291]MBW0102131.1 hypothetical protein [Pseudonocardia sp. KRD291]